mgnify:FL=1
MAEIRLSKIARQFNIGLGTLIDFLNGKGANITSSDPNAKISDEFMPAVEAKFGGDLAAKQDSEKVATKLKEMIDVSKKKPSSEEDEAEKEVIIKTTSIAATQEKPAVAQKPVEAPVLEKQPEPVVEETPAPVAVAPVEAPVEKVVETPVVASAPVEEVTAPSAPEKPAEEEAQKPERESFGPKIIDKIDLDSIGKKKPVVEEKPAEPEAPETQETVAESPAAEPVKPVEEQPVRKEPREAVIEVEKLAGPKVMGKVDLSKFETPKKKGKRERIKPGQSQKVDVTKINASNNQSKGGNGGGKNGGGFGKDGRRNDSNGGGKGRNRGKDRFKPAMTEAETEEMQKEIQKQIKETYARMNEGKGKNNFGAKHRKEKREAAADRLQEEIQQQELDKKVLKVTEFVTVNDLATLMNNTPVTKVIAACMSLGLMVSINQRLDAETLVLVAEEFGYEVEFVTANLTEEINSEEETDKPEDLVPRPPVITVMGHVDHGKTSLLDYIRKANVIAGEAGGITQHIGAYNVKLPSGRRITFLDTPGHEAFTAMRARGAKMTDLAIIIIAADDAIMPQTVEAISHAQAAGVPMVFAINKIDKPGANPDKIREQLSNMNILVEDWGGKYQCQEISAKKGINVDLLLDKVLLEADMLDLKANPNRRATGAVIESSLDKGRGYLATVLVQNGTMRVGDVMLSGCYTGRVKAMFNERGQKVDEAGPSTPVSVLGLNGAPTAGETFNIMADEREAKEIANKREQLIRIQGIKTQKHMTLEEIGRRIAIGNFKELNVIVKGDVDGSVEALSDSLIKLSTEEVRVNVIHKAVGAISESDVLLAAASDAVIIGFQVRPSTGARKLAEKEEIEIRLYSVIYDAINEVKDGIEGMLAPEEKEEITATAEVLETFKISKVGTIAGAIVREGKLQRTSKIRVIRDGIVVYTGELGSLKRFKDDVKEVVSGQDCGLNILNYNDIKVGDIVEAYQVVEVKRTL